MRRRKVEVFSLSFLDCICCGFGAVVLFYTIVAGQAGIHRLRNNDELQAQVNKLEEEVLIGTRNLVLLRNTLQKTQTDTAKAAARAREVTEETSQQRAAALAAGATSEAQRAHISQLKAELKTLEEGTKQLEVQGATLQQAPAGERVRAFRGKGNRQYLAGIELKGKHILLLLDRSASMMSDQVDVIIKLRNQSAALRRAAPKWRQAMDIADWLSTQLPAGSKFQMYGFNTTANALVAGTDKKWLDAADAKLLAQAVDSYRSLTPEGGTSLINAWEAIRGLSPRPDQVVLVTDGLPTQGKTRPSRKYVDVDQRARLFNEAVRDRPVEVPIDVILLPMQGDQPAPHSFWALATDSGGRFMMPSSDWP
jgi:hypothetical protein